jgi:hypothetical protein
MSRTTSRDRAADRDQAAGPRAADAGVARPRRGGGRPVAAGLAVVVVLGAGAAAGAWRVGVFSSGNSGSSANSRSQHPPATAAVTRQDLVSQTPVDGTLGYADSWTVTGKGGGTLTWLPSPGQVISQGQVLYKTDNGAPVVLLYGTVPAWRTLAEGVSGQDVSQLNHDLVRLGHADSADISALGWDYFSWETSYGVQQLQAALGITSPSGSLTLGSAMFEPAALRVSQVHASLGGPAAGPVLTATSTHRVVTVSLPADQQSEVKVGDKVTVTLPDQSTTGGTISSVGTVATGSGSSAAIPVYVTLAHPSVAGRMDQAPVTVEITTASVPNALTVPVGALLARSAGGYAVEVTGSAGSTHLVPVRVGMFDDASGLVQVTGALAPGEHVVVPSS